MQSWAIEVTHRLTRRSELWGPLGDTALETLELATYLNRWHPEAWHVPVRTKDELPPARLDWSQRRFSHCQATEDDCDYHLCPRWRDGALISTDHCWLDLIGREEEATP